MFISVEFGSVLFFIINDLLIPQNHLATFEWSSEIYKQNRVQITYWWHSENLEWSVTKSLMLYVLRKFYIDLLNNCGIRFPKFSSYLKRKEMRYQVGDWDFLFAQTLEKQGESHLMDDYNSWWYRLVSEDATKAHLLFTNHHICLWGYWFYKINCIEPLVF